MSLAKGGALNSQIKRLEARIAYEEADNPWVCLYFDRVQFPDGKIGRYNRLVMSEGRPGVVILPLRAGRVGLVQQYRYPIARTLWELPRGFGESADPRSDAQRELREELGVDGADLIDLGTLHPDSGLVETEVHVYLAKCHAGEIDGSGLADGHEISGIRWIAVSQLWDEIAEGRITDAFTLSAVAKAMARGLLG